MNSRNNNSPFTAAVSNTSNREMEDAKETMESNFEVNSNQRVSGLNGKLPMHLSDDFMAF